MCRRTSDDTDGRTRRKGRTVAPANDRAVAPTTMIGLLLFVAVVLGGVLALTVITA